MTAQLAVRQVVAVTVQIHNQDVCKESSAADLLKASTSKQTHHSSAGNVAKDGHQTNKTIFFPYFLFFRRVRHPSVSSVVVLLYEVFV